MKFKIIKIIIFKINIFKLNVNNNILNILYAKQDK